MKQFDKIHMSTKSLRDQAYTRILNDIKMCVLYPGEHVAINELSENYGIGISPIRDALQQLISEGFVIPVPRYGFIITPITLSDIQDLFEVRMILEVATVRLAIQRATQNQIDEILINSDLPHDIKDQSSFAQTIRNNFLFHNAIYEAGGNHKLREVLNGVNAQLERVYFLGMGIENNHVEAQLDHKELANAIVKKDLELAVSISTEQILRFKTRVIQNLSNITEGLS